jgi:MFS family permease
MARMTRHAHARRTGPRRLAVDIRSLRQSRPFRLILIGQTVSTVGRQITLVAVPYQVFTLTRSPLDVGLLGLAQVVPLVAVSILGGTLPDRMDRRRLLLITQSLQAVTSLLLLAGAIGGHPPLLYLYSVIAAAAAIQALDAPSRFAIIPNVVEPEHLQGALSLNIALFQASALAGPALAGLLIARFGLVAAYLTDVATFAVPLVAIWALPPQRPAGITGEPRLVAIRRGFAFVRRQPVILGGFALDLVAMIFGLPRAVFPVLALDAFRVGPHGLGLLYAAPGAGAVLAALATGWMTHVRRQGLLIALSVAVWGLAIAGFGLVPSFWIGLLLLAIAGAADSFSAVSRNTSMQQLTPDELRGRLTAVYFMVVVGGPLIGDLEAGACAQLIGPRPSVVAGGVACMLGALAIAALFPALVRYRTGEPGGEPLSSPR